MKIFLTEYKSVVDDFRYEGIRIEAYTLEEAEKKAEELGITLVGEWV
jgi:hypothetical protein